MTRKRCHRRVTIALPPRGLRATLAHAQVQGLALAHITNLDAISRGEADASLMWQWAGGIFTWSRVAELLKQGEAEMDTQLRLADSVITRWERTGRVGFSGLEYQTAKSGVEVMDELARIVDCDTALAAAAWSEARINSMGAAA